MVLRTNIHLPRFKGILALSGPGCVSVTFYEEQCLWSLRN